MNVQSKAVQDRIEKFSVEVSSGDLLGRVVRAQLYLERQLLTIIERSVKVPETVPKRLEYSLKIKWCHAFGMSQTLAKPLAAIAEYRNSYAHYADYELTKKELTDSFNGFSDEFRELMLSTMRNMLKDAEEPARSLPFRELPAPDTFSLLALSAWTSLLKETSRLTGLSYGEAILMPPVLHKSQKPVVDDL
ncbi:hypothetical protein [Pseudoxanthomonas wuyuanensis]